MIPITDLGEIGATGGILRPLELVLERDMQTWDLSGYTNPTLVVHTMSGNPVPVTGTTTIHDAEDGVIRYAPAVDDPIHDAAGTYAARIWVTPPSGGDPEPSGRFHFTIGTGPSPT